MSIEELREVLTERAEKRREVTEECPRSLDGLRVFDPTDAVARRKAVERVRNAEAAKEARDKT
jgi:hypothetical protein